jgi:hypothetical protein
MKICFVCNQEKPLIYFPDRFGRGIKRETLSCNACNTARKLAKDTKSQKKRHMRRIYDVKRKIYERRTHFRKLDNIPISV